jgi:hypothetical protein
MSGFGIVGVFEGIFKAVKNILQGMFLEGIF